MEPSRIVMALGGNALGTTPEEQKVSVRSVASTVVSLLKQGHRLVIGHGNGPQVGAINLAFEMAHQSVDGIPSMPFAECNAMSQGYIGFHLQQAIQNAMIEAGLEFNVASIVTQVEVDSADQAFMHPTKPIGLFYTREEADQLENEHGWRFMEDSGRGFRRVVPSPQPQHIVELETVRTLLRDRVVVITVGGGGIPVIRENHQLVGTDAVIDKDASSSKLASQLGADVLLILTAVDNVFINFGTPEQERLEHIGVDEARAYLEAGQFGEGSMKPKIAACLSFLEETPNGRAVITSLENAADALTGGTATMISHHGSNSRVGVAAVGYAD